MSQEERAREFVRQCLLDRRAGIAARSWVAGEEPYGMWDYMRLASAARDRVFRAVWEQERK